MYALQAQEGGGCQFLIACSPLPRAEPSLSDRCCFAGTWPEPEVKGWMVSLLPRLGQGCQRSGGLLFEESSCLRRGCMKQEKMSSL